MLIIIIIFLIKLIINISTEKFVGKLHMDLDPYVKSVYKTQK